MSVIVNEIKREVRKVSIETQVVGKSYTITLSERDAALVFYLTGALCRYGARVFEDLLPFFGEVDALRHNRIGAPSIDLPRATEDALNLLPNEVK